MLGCRRARRRSPRRPPRYECRLHASATADRQLRGSVMIAVPTGMRATSRAAAYFRKMRGTAATLELMELCWRPRPHRSRIAPHGRSARCPGDSARRGTASSTRVKNPRRCRGFAGGNPLSSPDGCLSLRGALRAKQPRGTRRCCCVVTSRCPVPAPLALGCHRGHDPGQPSAR